MVDGRPQGRPLIGRSHIARQGKGDQPRQPAGLASATRSPQPGPPAMDLAFLQKSTACGTAMITQPGRGDGAAGRHVSGEIGPRDDPCASSSPGAPAAQRYGDWRNWTVPRTRWRAASDQASPVGVSGFVSRAIAIRAGRQPARSTRGRQNASKGDYWHDARRLIARLRAMHCSMCR